LMAELCDPRISSSVSSEMVEVGIRRSALLAYRLLPSLTLSLPRSRRRTVARRARREICTPKSRARAAALIPGPKRLVTSWRARLISTLPWTEKSTLRDVPRRDGRVRSFPLVLHWLPALVWSERVVPGAIRRFRDVGILSRRRS
jgi:hypothetical protein